MDRESLAANEDDHDLAGDYDALDYNERAVAMDSLQ